VGKVVRHFKDGFAVRFKDIQDLAGLERVIIHDWADEAAGAIPFRSCSFADGETRSMPR
jgi:hypothetical protein